MNTGDFKNYLIKKGFVEKSIQRMSYCANHYQSWITEKNITTAEATYKDLLNYIGDLQKSKSKPVINEHLRAVSLHNRYLQIPDIAYQVRVRGIEKNQQILFTAEELSHLYKSYEPRAQKGFWRYSDKILLGFSIYQALDPKDVYRIELEHVDLEEGKIYVPSGQKRKAARKLNLEAHQILQLHHYIENHRDKKSKKLISPQAESFDKLHQQFKNLAPQIKAVAETLALHVTRISQFRQSRITLWIKQYGLRKAQYMAGFKRVENAERYRSQDTEDLKEYLLQFHPLQ